MTVSVRVDGNVSRCFEIVEALRADGFVQGTDFSFAYTPGAYDDSYSWTTSYSTFTFYTDAVATYFTLKYT